jgi:hypothetical protein
VSSSESYLKINRPLRREADDLASTRAEQIRIDSGTTEPINIKLFQYRWIATVKQSYALMYLPTVILSQWYCIIIWSVVLRLTSKYHVIHTETKRVFMRYLMTRGCVRKTSYKLPCKSKFQIKKPFINHKWTKTCSLLSKNETNKNAEGSVKINEHPPKKSTTISQKKKITRKP